MARQQYNKRQIQHDRPARITHQSQKRTKVNIPSYARPIPTVSARHKPHTSNAVQPELEAARSDVQRALVDWLLNELDPWFYTAIEFRDSLFSLCPSITFCSTGYKDGHSGSRYLNQLGMIQFEASEVKVVAMFSSRGLSEDCDEQIRRNLHRTIPYADPDLFDLIKDAIKRIYNHV